MVIRRVRPLIWLDELQTEAGTGLLDIANMQMAPSTGFDQSEVDEVKLRCRNDRGRRLVISVHKTPNAAQGKLQSRKQAERWAGVELATARIQVPDDIESTRPRWTAVTAAIAPEVEA